MPADFTQPSLQTILRINLDGTQVIAEDDIVDEYFDRIKQELIPQIAQNPANGERAIDLLMIAKYFERIGDHAVNIAEWVIFSVTGIHKSSEL